MESSNVGEDRGIAPDNPTYKQIKINQLKYEKIVGELEELQLLYTTITVFSKEEIDAIDIKITDPSGTPTDPKQGSLYDPRMGTVMDNRACATCHNTSCIGHDGMISFPKPIVNPLWMSLVINILRSVCNNCGALLIRKQDIYSQGLMGYKQHTRVSKIADMSKGLACKKPNRLSAGDINFCVATENESKVCDENYEYFNHDIKEYRIFRKGTGGIKIDVKVNDIYNIFSCITDDDAFLLGFENGMKPKNLIMFNMIVMPPVARPYVPSKTTGQYMPNDITRTYEDILNSVIKLNENRGDNILYRNLFLNVKKLMEGKKSKNKAAKNRMSISQMLQGKKSALRHTLMGKSTNRCARTVIGPDTSLRLVEVGIPMEWAKILTIEETVTHINKNFLKKLFDEKKITQIEDTNGPNKGFKRTVREDTSFPMVGSKVYRHMMDGDVIVLNRQPTLHKFGMMAFEVVLKEQRNITFHVSVTTPYNADFDGDEMNLWAEEILGARAEAQELMFAAFNAQSTTKNKPNMGLVYDAITASYLLTDEKEISVGLYCTIRDRLTQTSYLADLDERLKRYHVNPLSGKGVFSMLFPPDFNYFNGGVYIVDGVMLAGRLTGDHVSHAGGSIVEKLILEYGADEFIDFLTDGSYMVLEYITETGFSVGVSDCMAMDKEERELEEIDVQKIYQKIQSMVDLLTVPKPEDSAVIKETYENAVSGIIREMETMGFTAIKEKTAKTAIGEMMSEIGGGAKGKPFNIRQIRKMLAGQFYRGKRLAGPACLTRATPGYDIGEVDIRSAGFITSNFMGGLTPDEHFMHMLAGREGLIDTAINVSAIGDLHRKIIKALENLHIGLNESVINNIGIVFQIIYGGDGLDPAKLIKIKPKGSTESFAAFINLYSLARDLNIKKGWVPVGVSEGVRSRKKEEAKLVLKGEEDLASKINKLKRGYGRGMGMVNNRTGNKGIQNKRLQRQAELYREADIEAMEKEQIVRERTERAERERTERERTERTKRSEREMTKTEQKEPIEREQSREGERSERSERIEKSPERKKITRKTITKEPLIEGPTIVAQKPSTWEPTIQKPLEKKDISRYYTKIDSKYILKTKIAIKSAAYESIYYSGKPVWVIRDSENFGYGTFVRGLGYFLKLKEKYKGIITTNRSDSEFLGIISFMASLANLPLVIVVRKMEDTSKILVAKEYGAEIVEVDDSDKIAKEKVDKEYDRQPTYKVISGSLEEDDYISELSTNLLSIKDKYKINSTNIFLKVKFEAIRKALIKSFPESKVEVLQDTSDVNNYDLIWLDF